MDRHERTEISKFLSLVLRHNPESIGLHLDKNGWASIQEIISKADIYNLNFDKINEIVQTSEKKRFTISTDQSKIRANQGHSINISLDLKAKEPPSILYHGTATRFIESIKKSGLHSQERNHVHLSDNIETATEVGKRYGKPVILKVLAFEMHQQKFNFYLSDNGVWLTNEVPTQFIIFE